MGTGYSCYVLATSEGQSSAVVRVFNDRGETLKEKEFHPGGRWNHPKKEGSFEKHGDRVTKLGTNMYVSPQTGVLLLCHFGLFK